MGKHVIDDVPYVECPYCESGPKNQFKMMHWKHLKSLHGKTIDDLLREFPSRPTITKDESNKRAINGSKASKTHNKIKNIRCIHCGCEMEVRNSTSNTQACQNCITGGHENPDGKTKPQANERRASTLQNKHGEHVTNANQVPGATEKATVTCEEKYGGKGFASDELAQKSIKTMQENFNKPDVTNAMHIKEIAKKVGDKSTKEANPERAKKISEALTGMESKLKGKDYVEIHGNEIADKLKEDKRLIFRSRFIENEFPKLLDYFGFEFIDEKYEGSHIFHNFKCKKCGLVLNRQWNSIQQNYRCTNCYHRNDGTSIGEKEVLNFIKSVLPNDEIIENTRRIIPPKHLDIYIPSKNIAIEYNGLYWHSEQSPGYSNPKYHLNKTNECEKKDIKLIHVFEDEWIYKKEIVMSRLLQIIGINKSERLHGRECIVKEISSKEKNLFLDKFHIQGSDLSTIKLGAFHNDILVSVMTFSKGNPAKGIKYKIEGVWELNRFCSDSNYHIPGIAGKLLAYFKNNYSWIEIYSYADRRWSFGNLYEVLGFDLQTKKPQLNYWYVKGMKRIHRYKLRKKSHEPKDITEKTLRLLEGYNIIWDCGSLKYSLKNI